MQLNASQELAADVECSVLVVVAFEGDSPGETFSKLDVATQGLLSELLAAGEIATDLCKTTQLFRLKGVAAKSLFIVGGGSEAEWTQDTAFRAAGTATKHLALKPCSHVVLDFGSLAPELAAAAVAGGQNGAVGQDIFRTEKSLQAAQQVTWLNVDATTVTRGQKIGEAMLLTRELVNLPANYMVPTEFTRRAAQVAVSSGLELEVWDELKLRREGCGAMLAVSAGSTEPPRLLILRYPGKKKQRPLALVGKGVTFDSGGLSLKPSDGMLSMKCDMAGAATVLGVMQAVAALGVESPVVGLVGLVENMVSGSSFKLGDVLTARSGKTIEVHNTDAEGRLVLADVLDVALEEEPANIVDIATLTGACVVALGLEITGTMTNNAELQASVLSAAENVGEQAWPLPMNAHFSEQIKSKVADIKNLGEGRWGGAITAAKFLQEFVGDYPWVHLDIAGPAFADAPKPYMDAGASAAMVRTLIELAENS